MLFTETEEYSEQRNVRTKSYTNKKITLVETIKKLNVVQNAEI